MPSTETAEGAVCRTAPATKPSKKRKLLADPETCSLVNPGLQKSFPVPKTPEQGTKVLVVEGAVIWEGGKFEH